MNEIYRNREAAGRQLAARVAALHLQAPVVVALPRGGVPVAAEVSRVLGAPLALAMVRKLGAPGQRELAVGAVVDGEYPEVVIDEDLAAMTGADNEYLEAAVGQALREIERRRGVYLQGRPAVPLASRDVVVVDDGIATGASMKAALHALRRHKPARLVLAVPVASRGAIEALSPLADVVVCLWQPEYFHAVGAYFADFRQVEDDEVVAALQAADAALRMRHGNVTARAPEVKP